MSKLVNLAHHRMLAEASQKSSGRLIGEVAQAAADALIEMDAAKADKPEVISLTIPREGWVSDSNVDYPLRYDIAVKGMTDSDIASVMIDPASMSTAIKCGLCPTCETLAGAIRLRSVGVPGSAMTAVCRIEHGKDDE